MDQIQHATLQRLYDYWNEKRGARRFPARGDIDPLEFGYLLGWIMLIDVSHDPIRFRFRVYGSEITSRMGADMTGKDLDEHPHPEFARQVTKAWTRTVERGEPTCTRFEGWVGDRHLRFESLRLPLSSDGERIDMLLVGLRDFDLEGSEG